MIMQIADYYPILIQILIAASIGVVVLVASHVFGQRGTSVGLKDEPYECGMLAQGSGHARFAVKFYVTAMLFILFDIEVIFLVPWVLVFRSNQHAQQGILFTFSFPTQLRLSSTHRTAQELRRKERKRSVNLKL